MKSLSVTEIKAKFSEVLKQVQQGESFVILYGKKKKPVAMIVRMDQPAKKKKRKLGILKGNVKYIFSDDFKMTDEELINLKC